MNAAKIVVGLAFCICLFPIPGKSEQREQGIEVTISPGTLEEIEQSRPKEVFVYEVQPGDPKIWMEKFRGLANISGKAEEEEDLLRVKEGDRYLEVRGASNSVFYGDMGRLWREEPSPERSRFKVPTNEETKRITWDLLSNFGFSSEDSRNLELSVSDSAFELSRPGKAGEPMRIVVGKNVAIRRRIDDLLVYGPGSKIKVYIGENGSVNGYMVVWRQIKPSSGVLGHQAVKEQPKGRKVTPITSEEAFEILKKNPLDHLPLALVYKIDIDKVEFGYYSRSATEHQKYLQPVYVFYGTAYAKLPEGKEVSVPYEQFIVALEKPFEPIWPETRDLKAEPRRAAEARKLPQDEDEKAGKREGASVGH